jgi:hypothetical protein
MGALSTVAAGIGHGRVPMKPAFGPSAEAAGRHDDAAWGSPPTPGTPG